LPQPTTEVCPFALEAIAYLERNDITSISLIGNQLLAAKDGNRDVYIWLTHMKDRGIPIPAHLFGRGNHRPARVDVLALHPDGRFRWLINVVEQ
jgi:hypothetical protein